MLSPSERKKTLKRLAVLAGQLPDESHTRRAIEQENELGRIHTIARQERAVPLLAEEARVLGIARTQGYAAAERADRHRVVGNRTLDAILAETHSPVFRSSPGWNAYRLGTVVQCTACGRSVGRPIGEPPDSVNNRRSVIVEGSEVVDVRCDRHSLDD